MVLMQYDNMKTFIAIGGGGESVVDERCWGGW